MTYEEFNHLCQSLPATSYVRQWGEAHVWKVDKKVFAIGGWEKVNEPAFTFKTSQLNFHLLQEEEGFRAAPYMASRGLQWIQQYHCPKQADEALRDYILESHRLVSLGLSKKRQKELGLNQS